MATTQITVTAFKTCMAELADAVVDEDWNLAWKKYAQAQAIHLGLLNVAVEDEQTRMDRHKSLEAMRQALTSAQQATGGTAAGSNQVSFTRGIPR